MEVRFVFIYWESSSRVLSERVRPLKYCHHTNTCLQVVISILLRSTFEEYKVLVKLQAQGVSQLYVLG